MTYELELIYFNHYTHPHGKSIILDEPIYGVIQTRYDDGSRDVMFLPWNTDNQSAPGIHGYVNEMDILHSEKITVENDDDIWKILRERWKKVNKKESKI